MSYELEVIKKQLNEIKTLNNLLKKALEKKGEGNLYLILETLTTLFTHISEMKKEHSFILKNQNKIIEILLENRKIMETLQKDNEKINKRIEDILKEIENLKNNSNKKKGLFS